MESNRSLLYRLAVDTSNATAGIRNDWTVGIWQGLLTISSNTSTEPGKYRQDAEP